MKKDSKKAVESVAGLDVGDKFSHLCVLDLETGEMSEESRLMTTEGALRQRFSKVPRMRIALEAGAHSQWIDRLLGQLGHEVLVANPRKLRLIYGNKRKSDKADATYLARLARMDPKLLAPVQHRKEQAQVDLAVIRARDALIRARTKLINHARGVAKSMGGRLPKKTARSFDGRMGYAVPEPLQPALMPLLEAIAGLRAQILSYDRRIENMARTSYPETARLMQVRGVGALSALSFVLTIEDPRRFTRSRTVGAYLGLVPGRNSSGESDPQRRITKEGDEFLRKTLVQCAHYLMGPFGEDCDLRRHGEKIAQRGGKNGKKRACVAVARKLGVLLHHLWLTGETYEPLHNASLGTKKSTA